MYFPQRIVAGACLLACLVLGCDEATRAPATSPSAQPSSNASAATEAKAGACTFASLHKELLGYCEAGLSAGPPGMVALPWDVPPGKRPTHAVEIFITRNDQINIEGSITSVNAFASVWERKTSGRRQGRPTPAAVPWLLAVGPKVEVTHVATIMQALTDRGDLSGHLVFSDPMGSTGNHEPRDPARLAKLHAKIDSADLNQKAQMLAMEIQKSKFIKCMPLVKVFSAVSATAPDKKCELLALGFAKAFPQCQCQHADEILTLMYAVMADTEPPARRGAWVPLSLSTSASRTVIESGTSWSSFISKLDKQALRGLNLASTAPNQTD